MQLDAGLKSVYAAIGKEIVVVPRDLISSGPKARPESSEGEEPAEPTHPPFRRRFTSLVASTAVPKGTKLILPHLQYNDEFIRAMASVVRWSRWCGALSGGGSRAVRAWAAALAALIGFVVALTMQRLLCEITMWSQDGGAVSSSTAGLVFYLNALGTVALTWRLGGSWARLAARWAAAERALAAYAQPPEPQLLRRDVRAVVAVVTVGSLVEHVMSLVSAIGPDCPPGELLRSYILTSHGFLLAPEQYTWFWGVLLLFVSHVATVLWNLQDLLVVLLSVALRARYRRLNAFAESIDGRCETHSQGGRRTGNGARPLWRAAREAFARQAALVRQVDDAIGPLVLLSLLNNFYFICLQMFNGIASVKGVVQRCYFMLSLSWLCARAAGMVLAASAVHQHSRVALAYTSACPSHHFTVEVHRLQMQLSRDTVALTGMGFFEITRSFLLKVTGAIITYEIVLVQFNQSICN